MKKLILLSSALFAFTSVPAIADSIFDGFFGPNPTAQYPANNHRIDSYNYWNRVHDEQEARDRQELRDEQAREARERAEHDRGHHYGQHKHPVKHHAKHHDHDDNHDHDGRDNDHR